LVLIKEKSKSKVTAMRVAKWDDVGVGGELASLSCPFSIRVLLTPTQPAGGCTMYLPCT
jgi:hypothetical protein